MAKRPKPQRYVRTKAKASKHAKGRQGSHDSHGLKRLAKKRAHDANARQKSRH